MMTTSISTAASLLLFATIATAQNPAKETAPAGQPGPEVKVEYVLSEGDQVLGRTAVYLYARFAEESDSTATLVRSDGGRWTVGMQPFLGGEDEEKVLMFVEVLDPVKLEKTETEDGAVLKPVQIFATTVEYRGPGTYPLFEQGNAVLSVKIHEVPRKDAKPAPAPEKK